MCQTCESALLSRLAALLIVDKSNRVMTVCMGVQVATDSIKEDSLIRYTHLYKKPT